MISKKLQISRPSASNFKSFFRSRKYFFSHSRSEQFWKQNTFFLVGRDAWGKNLQCVKVNENRFYWWFNLRLLSGYINVSTNVDEFSGFWDGWQFRNIKVHSQNFSAQKWPVTMTVERIEYSVKQMSSIFCRFCGKDCDTVMGVTAVLPA